MIGALAGAVEELALRPAPALEEAATFTPAADIAAMRHEAADHRLFAN
jgi:urease accessory protein UreF